MTAGINELTLGNRVLSGRLIDVGGWAKPGPPLEGTNKGRGLREPQKIGGFVYRHRLTFQIFHRHALA